MSEHTECEHDMSDVEIVSRREGHGVEVEGHCPKCGAKIYGCADVTVYDG